MDTSFLPQFTDLFKTVGFFALIALLPFVIILMTSFTRISIILTFLRQALSTSVPSAQIIFGLSLILTAYVMQPVIKEINEVAIKPYFNKEISDGKEVVHKAWPPLSHFMLANTREKDLALFLEMGKSTPKEGEELSEEIPKELSEEITWYTIIPAFVLSELRIAFMIGFLLFLPFLIIDMVVTSLLMSMGMFMLPPTMISFPFKLLLFVVVDGWHLITQQLVVGFTR